LRIFGFRFYIWTNKAAFFKSGFNVAIRGTNLYDITDENGYFEINGVPSGTHTLVITRPYYLDETITNIVTGFEDRVEISTVAKPIKMTAGNIVVDGTINKVFCKIKFLTFAKFSPRHRWGILCKPCYFTHLISCIQPRFPHLLLCPKNNSKWQW